MKKTTVSLLVKYYAFPIVGRLACLLVHLLGADIPKTVQIGKNVNFAHNAIGTVIHRNTTISDNVVIFHGVTLGKAAPYEEGEHSFLIENGAILCAGCKVLNKGGILRIGKNAVVGANSVLTHSINDNEIWAGIPAHFIRFNQHDK